MIRVALAFSAAWMQENILIPWHSSRRRIEFKNCARKIKCSHSIFHVISQERRISFKKQTRPYFKILPARPEVCSSLKLDTQLHLTNTSALENFFVSVRNVLKLQLFGRDRNGVGATVSCALTFIITSVAAIQCH